MTEDEKSEMERFDVNYEQLNWRRRVLQDKCNGDISKFRQEYPSDPDECFLMSSRPRFHMANVESMYKACSDQSSRVGNITVQGDNKNASFYPDRAGMWKIYDEPEYDSKYLISVDTCTGEDQQTQGLAADLITILFRSGGAF